jgi:fatty-acyl-CoA synthase
MLRMSGGAITGSAISPGTLARYKLPTVLHLVDSLPRNASGKVMKAALRRQYGARP